MPPSAAASLASGLRCIDCGTPFDLSYRLSCPDCGGLLEVEYDYSGLPGGPGELIGAGHWKWAPLLPVADPAHRVSLGEGGTPLLDCPRLAESVGVRALHVKFEGANPTGTVKDRSSTTAIGTALQFGFGALEVVSTGNAGSSIGAYASRAGLRSLVFCYHRAATPKLNHMRCCVSDLFLYDGTYDDMIGIHDRIVEELPIYDAGASRNPYKHEGKKVIGFEIADTLRSAPPDFVVAPFAVGETCIAIWRAFRDLQRTGWIDRIPTMVAVQSAGADPLVRAWQSGGELTPQRIGFVLPEGVAVGDPGAKGRWGLRLLRENHGLAVTVADDEVLAAQRDLGRLEGIYSGPTGAVTLAGLRSLCRTGAIPAEARVVCVCSETGLKSGGERPELPVMTIDHGAVSRICQAVLQPR